jgi:hypothetical protein
VKGLREIAQSAETMFNKVEITSSHLPPLLAWTCKSKKIKIKKIKKMVKEQVLLKEAVTNLNSQQHKLGSKGT